MQADSNVIYIPASQLNILDNHTIFLNSASHDAKEINVYNKVNFYITAELITYEYIVIHIFSLDKLSYLCLICK